MHKLVISDDEGKNTVVPLVRDEITIGRKEGNTIRLTERNVSRRHARIRRANGAFLLEDLGSYNGVKVNGKRIGPETKLGAGDQIMIGDYVLALQVDAVSEAPPPSSPINDFSDIPTSEVTIERSLSPMRNDVAESDGPPARLVLLYPPPGGAEFALDKKNTKIGRAENLDVCINHRSISREHAEIIREEKGFRILDLGSANGVRVNGTEVQSAIIKPADIVELGEVRLTYIGEGEEFIYDASMSDVPPPNVVGASARAILIGIGAVIIAVAGSVVVYRKLATPEDVRPLTPVVAAEAPATDTGAQFTDALTACKTALSSGKPEIAVAQANVALGVKPGDPDAKRCLEAAVAAQNESSIFARGKAAAASGNYEAAYFQFEQLPTESPLRAKPEVVDATTLYARALLDQGATLVKKNPTEAARLAAVVLAMDSLSAETVMAARHLQESAGAAHVTTHATSTHVAAATPAPAPTPTAAGTTAYDRAQACAVQGDSRCVVQALESSARTEREMSLLIETYRGNGNTQLALPWMRRYVDRYPNAPRFREYSQILARYNQ